MIRVVLDTNVLASGLIGTDSTPGQLLALWAASRFELVISDHILQELEFTLAKPYFQKRAQLDEVATEVARFRQRATLTAITISVHGIATHSEDDLVLATAASAQVDYLATGDKQLQALGRFHNVSIVSPRALLLLILQSDDSSS